MNQAADFITHFGHLAETLEQSTATQWLSEYRQKRLSKFKITPWPTTKTEHFKYNNLSLLTKHSFARLPAAPAQPSINEDDLALGNLAKETLCFIDGQLCSQLTQLSEHKITFFKNANESQRSFISRQLEKQNNDKNIFSVLNGSLIQDGILVEVDGDKSSTPLHIVHYSTENASLAITPATLIVKLAPNAKATVIEHFMSDTLSEEHSVLFNQIAQFEVMDNAQLTHYRLHLEHEAVIHLGQVDFWLNRDSKINSFHVGLGSKIKRLDINVYHQHAGSHADLNGVYLAQNKQQIDYHTNIEHRAAHCTSQEIFRGLIGGNAKGVFNGRIHIYPGAQKTLAELSNKNLLLSKHAEVNTKPELEIYADDVRCAHGATVAQMDKKALFYLLSRGIPKHQAELMLSFGFINELLDNLQDVELSNYLRPLMAQIFQKTI
jgi:Fe-S cluster assembly protein SufD